MAQITLYLHDAGRFADFPLREHGPVAQPDVPRL